jgi:hypothetical protein
MRGGAREGAGRPKKSGRIRAWFTLSSATLRFLDKLAFLRSGDKSVSRGEVVDSLVEEARKTGPAVMV